MYRIFIVEDDLKIAEILKRKLEQYGYAAEAATQFRDLLPQILHFNPHLVLLDINLPYYDGYYWCRQLRIRSSVPIIFLSARSGEMDQVMAIENGGDDFLTKPIQIELLLAKVKSVLRRTYGEYALASEGQAGQGSTSLEDNKGTSNELTVEGLQLLLGRNELHWNNKMMELTKNELLLAHCLMKDYGKVVSREKLLEALWDDVSFVDDNTLTVNVTRLRKKLEELGLPKAIETVRGLGYKLKLPSAAGN